MKVKLILFLYQGYFHYWLDTRGSDRESVILLKSRNKANEKSWEEKTEIIEELPIDSVRGQSPSPEYHVCKATFSERAHSLYLNILLLHAKQYLFPKVKEHILSVEEEKAKLVEMLKRVTSEKLQHCFEQWSASVQRCINKGNEFFKGDKSHI